MKTRFAEMKVSLKGRWKPEWSVQPGLTPATHAFHRSLDAITNLQAKAADLRQSGNYSEKGLAEELRSVAAAEVIPTLRQAARDLDGVEADIAKQQTALTIPPPDPNNAAQAIMRSEMRAWLRSLPGQQAVAVLLGDEVDDRMLQAAFEGPPIMAGLTAEGRDTVLKEVIERKFGPELEKLKDSQEALAQARAALQISLYQLREEAMFGRDEDAAFNDWMKKGTEKAEAAGGLKTAEQLEKELSDTVDAIFARAFPDAYPNHPVNNPLS